VVEEEIDEVGSDFRLISPGDFVLSPLVNNAGSLRTEKASFFCSGKSTSAALPDA
jgi:hypothetical protein